MRKQTPPARIDRFDYDSRLLIEGEVSLDGGHVVHRIENALRKIAEEQEGVATLALFADTTPSNLNDYALRRLIQIMRANTRRQANVLDPLPAGIVLTDWTPEMGADQLRAQQERAQHEGIAPEEYSQCRHIGFIAVRPNAHPVLGVVLAEGDIYHTGPFRLPSE